MADKPVAMLLHNFSGGARTRQRQPDKVATVHMTQFILPQGYARIGIVNSFHELVSTPLANGINALCWPRVLPGDFDEVAQQLVADEAIRTIDTDVLDSLTVSPAGKMAIHMLLEDQRLLREHGLEPSLDCVRAYVRDATAQAVPTDVYSFHVDSAPVAADTYLCSYTEAASEGLRNDQALRRVDIADTRAALLRQFGAEDGAAFVDYLNENCYDLHYLATPESEPFCFGLGNLWRIAIAYPGNPVPPCIHRAPATLPGRPARLLLIS